MQSTGNKFLLARLQLYIGHSLTPTEWQARFPWMVFNLQEVRKEHAYNAEDMNAKMVVVTQHTFDPKTYWTLVSVAIEWKEWHTPYSKI